MKNNQSKIIRIFTILLLTALWSNIELKAQDPLSQIEGRIEVWTGIDQSSLYIGKDAGKAVSVLNGMSNTILGCKAATMLTSGMGNSFFGNLTGQATTMGQANTFLGQGAGYDNIQGSSNCFIGVFSGRHNTDGARNVFIGNGTGNGYEFQDGDDNTFVGDASGGIIGSKNICLGASAGPSLEPSLLTASNRLYIDVNRTNQPLIYGEFDNRLIRVNGDLDVTGEITGTFNGSSDINLKEEIVKVDNRLLLEEVSKLPISEWQYIGNSERHVGPMAQDFYAAFGLGKGETTITTIDADGVALAAIQALYELNRVHEHQIAKLENQIMQLRNLMEE